MPVKCGRGFSQATFDKEDGLQKILLQHMHVVKAILNKPQYVWMPRCYHFIDAYAGPGENPEVGCSGSPMVFLDIASDIGIPTESWFIDIERNNTTLLKTRIEGNDGYKNLNYHVLTGDNKVIVPRIAEELPNNALGLIYADATNIPDFEMLGQLSKIPKLKMFDILIRYSATNVKRTQYLTGLQMRDYLRKIKKNHWKIRDILPGDKFQWTFLLGMNWDGMKDWQSQRFHKVDTEQGKAIFEKCNNMRHPNGQI